VGKVMIRQQGSRWPSSGRGYNTYPIIRKFYAGHHEDAPVAGFPIVVADKRALTGRAFALCDAGHTEADVLWLVEGGGVQDGNAVPTGLDLGGEVVQEA
jgi:hypothetical protein